MINRPEKYRAWSIFGMLAFWVFMTVYFLTLLSMNFLFTDKHESLLLREVDNYAFQVSLTNLWEQLREGLHLRVFSFVDYGYGFLFWILHFLFWLPAKIFGSVQMQLFIPQFLSQVFFFAGLYGVYLISQSFWNRKAISIISVLILATTPVFAYGAQRFHTHGLIFLLSTFALFFIFRAKNLTIASVVLSAILSGMATGIKAVGLFPTLVIGISILFLNWREPRKLLKFVVVFSAVWTFFAVFSLAPVLLTFRWDEHSQRVWETIRWYFEFSKTAVLGGEDDLDPYGVGPYSLLIGGYFHMYFSPAIWIFSFVGFLDCIRKGVMVTRLSGILIGCSIVFLYLLFGTAQGGLAMCNYFLGVVGLVIIGLGFLSFRLQRFYPLPVFLVFAIHLLTVFPAWRQSVDKYSDKLRKPQTIAKLKVVDETEELFLGAKKQGHRMRILRDYRVILPVSSFTDDVELVQFFNNISVVAGNAPFDFIVFYENAELFYLDSVIEGLPGKEQIFDSKRVFKTLEQGGGFKGSQYELVYRNLKTVIFRLRS